MVAHHFTAESDKQKHTHWTIDGIRPDVMIIGSMLSELAIAPALQDLIDALASSNCRNVTVVSRPFPSIVDNQKIKLRLIALPQVLIYRGKWRLLRWWNSF